MSKFDINFKMGVDIAVDIQTVTTGTTQGNVINLNDGVNNFEALELVMAVGQYTDGDFSLLLEESDDDVTYGAVDAEDILGDNTPISEAGSLHIGYVGKKQYVRTSVVVAAGATGADVSVVGIKGHPRSAPLG
jgi:hypothetical protein